MSHAPTDQLPAASRLRGLDPTALTGVLSAGGARPIIPGWEILQPLGEGGLGTVWKARRTSDGTLAALKVPRAEDITLVERLEAEASALRALDHPHIVRLIETGPLDDGGLYLAMEYIDGLPLSQSIPAGGFAPEKAHALFSQVMAAVAHAHTRGVLHRDLKPSNILLDGEGNAHVADFGLAHSVHERVQRLSLTMTGLVAGTAEYLPPEAYQASYQPAVSSDVYALGVILYDLLTGSPPRGAWRSVSEQKQVDIRIDDVLRRALDPDPAARWRSVEALAAEIKRILSTPPRYSGTPRLTRAVRLMDAAWTLVGLFLFLGALGLVVRIEKYGIGLPVDLIGTQTMRIGTYQSILILLMAAVPAGLWQLFRLWRFRGVPLREALPLPFGLRLDRTPTAALSVALAQLFCLIAPGVLGAHAWREQCLSWLNESSPPWEEGLVVTAGRQGMVAHDPWQWPEGGIKYSLRERAGWMADPFSTQLDHTNFIPGLIPRVVAGGAIFYITILVVTILSAFARWWRFRRWRGAVILILIIGFGYPRVQAERRAWRATHARESGPVAASRVDPVRFVAGKRIETLVILRDLLFPPDGPPHWDTPSAELLDFYGSSAKMDGSHLNGAEQGQYLSAYAARCRANGRRTILLREGGGGDGSGCAYVAHYEETTGLPSGPCTVGLTRLYLLARIGAREAVYVIVQDIERLPLYTVTPRPMLPAEAKVWAESLCAALRAHHSTGQPDPLEALFFPQLLHLTGSSSDMQALPRKVLLATLRTACTHGANPTLIRPPRPPQELSGARRRIIMELKDRGQPATWTADLVFTEGRWQCVQLTF